MTAIHPPVLRSAVGRRPVRPPTSKNVGGQCLLIGVTSALLLLAIVLLLAL